MTRAPPPPRPGPRDANDRLLPPPMRRVVKGWWTHRELGYAEAEADCLRDAAKLAGSPFEMHRQEQARLLAEADSNRAWGRWHGRLAQYVVL